ncbi:MAG TPA: glycosyltransferase family 1 protein [Roseateles sp.]
MTLNIGLIARTLNVPHLRGTGRYVQELLKNTRPGDDVRWTAYGHDPSMPFRVPDDLQGRADVFDFKGDRFHLWEQLGLPLRLRRAGVQLLHGAENTLPIWQPVPSVVTIHDTVLFEEAVAGTPHHRYLQDVQTMALRRCAHVITISESSRRDIARRWPFVADRMTVIPHGIGDEFFDTDVALPPASLQRALGASPYLLYLGGAQPRKRFGWALELLARSGRRDLHLVACGFGAGTVPGEESLPAEVRGRVHFAPFVTDAELVALYRGATAAVYPTLYEGFGFPAVEAQASGTPILFSPVSSLVDLVGPLAWAVPAEDFPAWQAALQEILDLPAHARAERAAQGIEWARRFSWRRSVEAHFAVYREVLSRHAR